MSNGEVKEPQEILPASQKELVAVSTVLAPLPGDIVERAAHHIKQIDQLMQLALHATRPHMWHFFGDRPWPMRGAVSKIRQVFGLNIFIDQDPNTGERYTKRFAQDEKGAYYLCTVSGRVEGPFGTMEGIGFCTSRDQFFAVDGKEDDGTPTFRPFFEIREENIAMSAYTNFVVNVVSRYTGLDGFTKADIEAAFGAGAVSSHQYAASKEKKTATDTAERSKQMKELAGYCMVMSDGLESDAALLCEQASSFTGRDGKLVPGKKSPKDLSDGRLTATLGTIKKWWAEFLTKQGEKKGFYEGLLKNKLEGGNGDAVS